MGPFVLIERSAGLLRGWKVPDKALRYQRTRFVVLGSHVRIVSCVWLSGVCLS
jgi:hypothetical protein